jgi:hypothetical protein
MPKAIDASGHRVRPPNVLAAIFRGDKEALSTMGRNGNAVKNGMRRLQKTAERRREEIFREAYLQRRDEEFRQSAIATNMHICPID